MIFLYFLIFCLISTALYALLAASVSFWSLLAVFALSYLAANLLFVLIFFISAACMPRLKPGEGVERQSVLMRRLCCAVARWLCGNAGMRVRFAGLEKLPEGPFLYVSNHRSIFDPLVVMGYLGEKNISFVSKPSNLEIPLVGRAARHAGFLAIDRKNNREALKTILMAADYLKRGVCNMGIYPEGTRSKTREMLPFHAGSFKIAQRAGVPVVVACTRGTERVAKTLFVWRTPVTVEILDVFEAGHVKATGTSELAEETRRMIRARLDETE
ncbi:MAG: 1-acyl-sn-glycerol-3-phosphate acyltransferase [Oscillospiraceae bacterium]|nr:1-acyl-sn-glycerol-3-phosphate acyltransferase [Oscillospiraceae bacterium]